MSASAPTITSCGLTDQGLVREENQDAFGEFFGDDGKMVQTKGSLFIVADGIGGHRGGREASMMAVNAVPRAYFRDSAEDAAESLRGAFLEANREIFEYSTVHPEVQTMGTTCTALLLKDRVACIAHVGDSRVYRIAGESIVQLTNDHSNVAEMQRRGILTPEGARSHPERSLLYRAMGVRKELEVDIIESLMLGARDTFVLSTDGLHGLVSDQEILKAVQSRPPQDACRELVGTANRRGGYDNITIVVVKAEKSDSFLGRFFR